MHFFKYIFPLALLIAVVYGVALPVDKNTNRREIDVDNDYLQEYAALRHMLIYDWGYTKEYADLVETNLKRAIRQEIERQRQLGIVPPGKLRQENQLVSEEDDEDEPTTPAGPTTPGASPGDVVRGVAGILHSLGTLDVNNFWGSFVNFFPPVHREGAQALVDASQGRRPAVWPTLPTTTTKLTTTTKDEDEIDSGEATTVTLSPVAPPYGPVAPAATTVAATGAPAVVTQATIPVTAAPTKAPTTKYTVRRRTATILPDIGALRHSQNLVDDIALVTSTQQTFQESPK